MLAQVNLGASLFKRGVLWISVFAAVLLAACSSTPDKPAPTALVPLTPQLTVKPVWSAQVGPIGSPLSLNANAGLLGIVSQKGLVTVLNAETGALAWQLALNTPVSAGIGSDGQRFAVITQSNELVLLSEGKEVWRAKLPAIAFTAPFVAGGRVFVLTTDRTVLAFDGASGQSLWRQHEPRQWCF